MARKLILIFFLAFVLNLVWENLHSYLYIHYRGGPITELVLLRAALVDAILITVLGVVFLKVRYFRQRHWYAVVFGCLAAVVLEVYALYTGRWAYSALMPIVPFVKTGLTPTIQLGVLAYLILKIVHLVSKKGERGMAKNSVNSVFMQRSPKR